VIVFKNKKKYFKKSKVEGKAILLTGREGP
jgi:hypothetical protein